MPPKKKKKKDAVVPGPEEFDEEITEQTIAVARETATGDTRDFILDTLRHEQDKRPWNMRSEAEQRDTAHRVETFVRDMFTRLLDILAAGGKPTIAATLDQVTVKDGITAKLVMTKSDPLRHRLFDATGSRVLILVSDPDEFTGERAPVAVTPDQGDIERIEKAGVVHSEPDATDKPWH